jgi:phosphoglycolate phosphatase
MKEMVPEPGLLKLLRTLKLRYRLGIATNRSNTISEVLRTHGLEGFFDIVVSSLDVQNPKPHPESLLKIFRFFQITAQEAMYVGDSLVDSQTARAAGVHFVAYKNPDLDADHHVSELSKIANLPSLRSDD